MSRWPIDETLFERQDDIIVVYGEHEPAEAYDILDNQITEKIIAYGFVNVGNSYVELNYFTKPLFFPVSFPLVISISPDFKLTEERWRFATLDEAMKLYQMLDASEIRAAWYPQEVAVEKTIKYLNKFVEFSDNSLVLSRC